MYFNYRNHLRGALIYAAGDTAAALLQHDFSWSRLLGVALVAGTVYAWEVPTYFRWIDRRVPHRPGWTAQLRRASLALAYFNPLWIARHFVFIRLASGHLDTITWALLPMAARSFLLNVPVSLAVNYFIQNKLRPDRRFLVSALFSGVMAVYYALSATWGQ
ncbi:hypothetical protein SAMN06265337_2102 [Hymenobacter gelipurpurascens]|uniref:Uncharacterized protein n=1 Tax=Hymenobacter gelipurpurascens TaxID=89968 RepID=A0A212TPU5_9BACT|nr:hypothetical protein [Hymenobacter gelipurpurascens]SNC67876.1 hypothetical protein SAMN06265337_2102 [Hymenobacter gelipurpurascens]